MKKTAKNIISLFLIVTFVMLSSLQASAYYADAQTVTVSLTPGLSGITANGEKISAQKAFIKNDVLFVPLRTVMEAFGAEITTKDGINISVYFGDTSADFSIREKVYSVNQSEKTFEAVPVVVNGSVFVPVSFITENFGISIEKKKTGGIDLILPDDGSLEDLNFLTGGLSKQFAGNSYFGWSASFPKASRVISTSFNSSYVLIENEQLKAGFEVRVTNNEGDDTLSFYNKISQNTQKYIWGEIVDIKIVDNVNPSYIIASYTDLYNEAVFSKIFVTSEYIISLTLTSYYENDPSKILSNKNLKTVLDTFKPSYPSTSQQIQDLSRISSGMARYENYIFSDTGKKYLAWVMNLLPEWNELYNGTDNPFYKEIGSGHKEYVSVEMTKPEKSSTILSEGEKLKNKYNDNFNSDLYTLISSGETTIDGQEAYRMVFRLKIGGNEYIYDEWLRMSGGILFDIAFKCGANEYESHKSSYVRMLESFTVSSKDLEGIKLDIDKYDFTVSRNKVGKDSSDVLYENKTYGWALSIPGEWTKSSSADSDIDFFSEDFSGMTVSVESIDESSVPAVIATEAKYRFLSSIVSGGDVEKLSEDMVLVGGKSARHLTYRSRDQETERFATIDAYIVKGDRYSYCLVTTVPDITASEQNLGIIKKIVDTFNIKK